MRRLIVIWFVLLFGCAEEASHATALPDALVRLEAGVDVVVEHDSSTLIDTPSEETTVEAGPVSVIVELGVQPESAILIPGEEAVIYRLTMRKEGTQRVFMRRLNVRLSGDGASYQSVSIHADGRVRGTATVMAAPDPTVDVALGDPVEILERLTPIEVRVEVARIYTCMSAPCHLAGVAHSGMTIAARIAEGETAGTWDVRYSGLPNIEVVNEHDDHVPVPHFEQLSSGFVVHKSRPIVRVLPLASTILRPGTEQEIFRFQVAADAAGAIGWVRAIFGLSSRSHFDASPLTNFRLLRGTPELPPTAYQLIDVDGRDLRTGGLDPAAQSWDAFLNLTSEEIVEGEAGEIFTLRAHVSDTVRTGDEIVVGFSRDATPPGCYYLTDAISPTPPHFPGLNLDLGVVNESSLTGLAPGGQIWPLDFGWTDYSEIPHEYRLGRLRGSRDFISSFAVAGLDGIIRLRR